MTLTAGIDDAGRRLDRILRKALPDVPLSALHRLLRKGLVLVNGSPARGGDLVSMGSLIELPQDKLKSVPSINHHKEDKTAALRQLPLQILWEGSGLLILNKPAGLAVHGSAGSPAERPNSVGEDTLNRRVQAYLYGKLPPSLSFKPGPLHRLDKPTSGIVVFGTSLEAARWFSALLAQGKICKRYLAILEGELTRGEVWEDTLVRDTSARKTTAAASSSSPAANGGGGKGGRRAFTRVTPLACARKYTFARLEIETGRTHQIRSQASFHGHPLAGDRKYGGASFGKGARRGSFFLHAAELELPQTPEEKPDLKGVPRFISAPLPELFSKTARDLFGTGMVESDH